jgi:hypothetical protein
VTSAVGTEVVVDGTAGGEGWVPGGAARATLPASWGLVARYSTVAVPVIMMASALTRSTCGARRTSLLCSWCMSNY